MKRYRLDPKKPRELTTAEARRVEAATIDYSDIPPLGDEFFRTDPRVVLPGRDEAASKSGEKRANR